MAIIGGIRSLAAPRSASQPTQDYANPDARPALDMANFLIDLSGYTKTPMQVQKMTYIAHGYSLALRNKPLFRDQVEAWDHGPVIPSIYDAFKGWGFNPIPEVSDPLSAQLTADERTLLEMILAEYGKYCGYYLSQLTHDDGKRTTPWAECYAKGKNSIIPNTITKTYYEEYLK